jgi:hypothetical protein
MNENVALVICVTILVILCAGSPDLLDAIVARMMR